MNRWLAPLLFSATLGMGALIACSSSETPPDVPGYGPPNGISGKHPAPPDGLDSGSASGGSSGGGSGSSSGSSGGGSGGTTFLCGTPVDGGTCSVSWKNDIYPKMKNGGTWGCGYTTGCHGTQGGTLPYIDPTDEHATYESLQKTMAGILAAPTPYINPCSTDPTKSLFVCNTSTTTCSAQMPLVSTTAGSNATTAADNQAILTWVQCGAPEN